MTFKNVKKIEKRFQVFDLNGEVRSWGEDFKTLKEANKFVDDCQIRKKHHSAISESNYIMKIYEVFMKRKYVRTSKIIGEGIQ